MSDMAHFNHFDFIAPYYDRFIKPMDPSRFIELAGLPVSGWLLDVGGGTGQKSQRLLHMVGGAVVADSSLGMLAQAAHKPGLLTAAAESERLPFADGSFERVIMVDALHHVSDQQASLGEMWRVLKPGGRIVIEEPDIRETPAKIMTVVEKILLMRSHVLSPRAIAARFPYADAKVTLVQDPPTAWVIIDKQAG